MILYYVCIFTFIVVRNNSYCLNHINANDKTSVDMLIKLFVSYYLQINGISVDIAPRWQMINDIMFVNLLFASEK